MIIDLGFKKRLIGLSFQKGYVRNLKITSLFREKLNKKMCDE
jgi:hypothetical protein